MPTWLIKSEPDAYSFDQLVRDGQTAWTGIRNYTARNHLRAMKVGDLLLFYHSNVGKAVVGLAKVVGEAYPDPTDGGDWSAVDVAPVRPLRTPVTLDAMRVHPILKTMEMFRLGRLSVVPVKQDEMDAVLLAAAAEPRSVPPPAPKKKAAAKKVAKKVTKKKAPAKKAAPKKKTASNKRSRSKSRG